jgi:hypothetical protein
LPYLYFAYSAASRRDDASLCVPPRGTPIATYASPTSHVLPAHVCDACSGYARIQVLPPPTCLRSHPLRCHQRRHLHPLLLGPIRMAERVTRCEQTGHGRHPTAICIRIICTTQHYSDASRHTCCARCTPISTRLCHAAFFRRDQHRRGHVHADV